MYTDAELADLRALSLEAMDATATITRPASTGASGRPYGTLPADPDTIAENVPCRVVENGVGRESATVGEIASVAPYIVQLDGAVDVRAEDTIVVSWPASAPGGARSASYTVVAPETPVSFQINTRAFCERAS